MQKKKVRPNKLCDMCTEIHMIGMLYVLVLLINAVLVNYLFYMLHLYVTIAYAMLKFNEKKSNYPSSMLGQKLK